MLDLLLPRTDAGVLAQVIGAAVVYAPLIHLSRRNHEVRLFVIGLCVITYAWFALRTVH